MSRAILFREGTASFEGGDVSYQLVEVEPWPDYEARRPGICWRVPLDWPVANSTYGEEYDFALSPEFRASGRDYVIKIVLPGGKGVWDCDHVSVDGASGWTITGELPNITASPSVDSGIYHGFLRDGAFTDDLEGRTYS